VLLKKKSRGELEGGVGGGSSAMSLILFKLNLK
jgi:hypothetical protein